jgi:hypothetical protein
MEEGSRWQIQKTEERSNWESLAMLKAWASSHVRKTW